MCPYKGMLAIVLLTRALIGTIQTGKQCRMDVRTTMQSYLEKRDPTKNLARFHSLMVLPDLFGGWTFEREWGRIGQSGQVRRIHFPSQEEATQALLEVETAKKRRGYWLRPQQLGLF